MTDSAAPINYEDHLRLALTMLGTLPDEATDPNSIEPLASAGRIVADRQNKTHRIMHRDAQLGGAVVWGMRERGLSWREIDHETRIAPRTAQRWMRLFLAEGVTERPSSDLDERWQNRAEGSDS